MKISFNEFINEEESFIKIPKNVEYWLSKGKRGKECIIYTHDDLDGIFSAIAMKEYLQSHGFKIAGYGIINYTDGWKIFKIDKSYINICVDFAEDNADLDVYIDHHMDEKFKEKSKISIKMQSDSCYGLICHILGIPTDKLILSVISMIDSAKYKEYGVDLKTILNFNLEDILKSKNPRLVFAGAFNQLIKRSDYRTLIEVIHNSSLSIYKIFKLFKLFYPINNLTVKRGVSKEEMRNRLLGKSEPWDYVDPYELTSIPEFVPDSKKRIDQMVSRTVGNNPKKSIESLDEFIKTYWNDKEKRFKFDGFVVLKNLIYVPTGTFANPLRARVLIERYLEDDSKIQFILMDYGSALQISDYRNIADEKNLPVLEDGTVIDDLNVYTKHILQDVLKKIYNYHFEKAKAGGHPGIGNLSNIIGRCNIRPFVGIKMMDLAKNWIIEDITGIKWDQKLQWNMNEPVEKELPEEQVNKKLMMVPELRKVNI